MSRNAYAQIHLGNLEHNVRTLVNRYKEYNYVFGVVKADCYGHNGKESVAAIRDAEHIRQIAEHLDTITYEVTCSVGKRVPRVYVK